MLVAADRLQTGSATVAAVAGEVGYESEAAFNRAFKRAIGSTPGAVRSTKHIEKFALVV